MRSAIWTATSWLSSSSQSTTNSSPPSRARVSPGRRTPGIRSATPRSRRSPASWPRLSLTALKRSRSMKSTATHELSRRARARAWRSRSSSRARLGRPVSASCSDWRSSSPSKALRSVMSWMKALKRKLSPSGTAHGVSSIGNTWPSRCSASSSTRRPSTGPSPVARKRAIPSLCAGRCTGGMIVSVRSRPSTSSRRQPKWSSAWRFHSVMPPVASMATKASLAVWMTWRTCSSLARSACRARLRSTTRPSWVPMWVMTSSSGSLGSRDARAKNSSTATTSAPTSTGKAKPARTPRSNAGRARGKF